MTYTKKLIYKHMNTIIIKIGIFVSILFIGVNLNAQTFTEQTGIALDSIGYSSTAWGDYDNDGDLDILITGSHNNTRISKIYRNNGNNTFTEQTAISLTGIEKGSVSWGDYNNDGYLDILMIGSTNGIFTGATSKIYKNNGPSSGSYSFTEQTGISLVNVYDGDIAWGDYDADGDLDFILTGQSSNFDYYTKIYRNNGSSSGANYTFSELTDSNIPNLSGAAIDWGDYDNDGDLDLLLTGSTDGAFTGGISKIYCNNGSGIFTEQTGISLIGVVSGDCKWADLDNDGDLDIILSGITNSYSKIIKIYKNNGNNTFSEQTGTSFPSLLANIECGDYDNDGDLDILLIGGSSFTSSTKIYKNNGNNTFSEQTSISLAQIKNGCVNWGDYDNDGDLDILINGKDNSDEICKIYKNNSSTPNTKPTTPNGLTAQIVNSKLKLSWNNSSDNQTPSNGLSYNIRIGTTTNAIDIASPLSSLNTGFRKIVSRGNIQSNFCYINLADISDCSNLYWSVQAIDNGMKGSNFSATKTTNNIFIASTNDDIHINAGDTAQLSITHNACGTVTYSWSPASAFSNPNLQNQSVTPNDTTTYYVTATSGTESVTDSITVYVDNFIENTNSGLPSLSNSTYEWGDYDNDGDYDIAICGKDASTIESSIYRNNGNGTFTKQTSISLTAVNLGAMAWGDYDNDGDLDLLISGTTNVYYSGGITKIFRNDGQNTNGWSFTEQSNIALTGITDGFVKWIDYNNDGTLDILLAGISSNGAINKLYKNNGNNTFSVQTGTPFLALYDNSLDCGDYDNDGDIDVLISGTTTSNSSGAKTLLYSNNGDSTFSLQSSISLTGVYNGIAKFEDYNNDGYLDIIIAGNAASNPSNITKIYKNNGNNSFTDQTSISIIGAKHSYLSWGDYNNDGLSDFIICGYESSSSNSFTKLYLNTGNNNFTEDNFAFPGIYDGHAKFCDYDNDGDLDILLMGENSQGNNITKLYENGSQIVNNAPSAPTGLSHSVTGNILTINWNKPTDDLSPTNGLSYNIRIGTSSNSIDVKSPQSNLNTGFHRVVQNGMSADSLYKLNLSLLGPLSSLSYSVQAIDKGYKASAFSSNNSYSLPFTIQASNDTTINALDTANIYVDDNSSNSLSYSWTPTTGLAFPNAKYPKASPLETTTYNVTVNNGNMSLSESVTVSVKTFEYLGNIPGYSKKSICWGDYNNDGYQDILTTEFDNYARYTKLYKNNGDSSFSEVNTNLLSVGSGSAIWGDYDNDGDLDVIVSGIAGQLVITKLYKNVNPANAHFVEQTGISLTGVYNSSIAWGDYNNDGNLDILLSGYTGSEYVTKIYKNNGNNSFTELTNTSIVNVANGSVAWGDYNNDSYLDILLTGDDGNYNYSRIYKNNAGNSFTEQSSIYLTDVTNSSASWGDYNNDGYLDIALMGKTTTGRISKIYKNNGNNTFSLQSSISLPQLAYGKMVWGDYDGDNYTDLLVSGQPSNSNSYICKLYRNINQTNTFEEHSAISESSSYIITPSFADYDNDGDLDLFVDSRIYSNSYHINTSPISSPNGLQSQIIGDKVKLSWNKPNSTANLSYNIRIGTSTNAADIKSPMSNMSTGFHRIASIGSIQDTFCLVSVNQINKSDCSNLYWSVQSIDKRYRGSAFSSTANFLNPFVIDAGNDTTIYPGSSIQLTANNNSCSNVTYSWSPASSLNNTTIQSPTASPTEATTYYVDVTKGGNTKTDSIKVSIDYFSEQTTSFPSKRYSKLYWVDYDKDGDLDVLVKGSSNYSNTDSPKLYKNNGNNSFIEQTGINFTGTTDGSADWGDYNNDGNIDLLLSVNTGYNSHIELYKNNGNNTFSKQTTFNINSSNAIWGDYDNDGDLDILTSRYIYKNNGNNTFSYQYTINSKNNQWIDYDNDGDLDIFSMGYSYSSGYYTKVYDNDKDAVNRFIEQTQISLPGVSDGEISFGDFNNDGYPDFILTGNISTGRITKLYKNNGSGNIGFTEVTSTSFLGVSNCHIDWGDYNQDGNIDILLSGYYYDLGAKYTCRVYKNTNPATGTFEFVEDIDLGETDYQYAQWGDYDNNGTLDILIGGDNISYQSTEVKIFKNNFVLSNTPPTVPTSLSNSITDGKLLLNWNQSNDNTTPSNTLSYNLMMGVSSNKLSIVSPNANTTNGKRLTTGIGNLAYGNSHKLNVLAYSPGTTLYWRVQSIDNGYNNSAFSSEKSISIPFIVNIVRTDTVSICPHSYSLDVKDNLTGGTLSYQWSPSIGLSNDTIKNPIASQTGTTTYYVTVTSSNSYSATDSFTVTIDPIPSADFSLSNQANVNENTTISYLGAASSSAEYTWNFDNANISSGLGQGPYQLSWDTTGTKYLSLSVKENNCTSNPVNKSIDIRPFASFTISDKNICTLSSTTITFDGDTNNAYSYSWSFDNANIISGSNEGPYTLTWSTPGYKHISLSITENGITSLQYTDSVYVKPLPQMTISALNPNIYVTDTASILLTGTVSQQAVFNWSLNGGTIVSSTNGSRSMIWPNSGNKTIGLTITGANGCESILDTTLVHIKPTTKFSIDTSACVNEFVLVNYTGSAASTATFNWNWDGGTVISGSGIGPYQILWDSVGTKNISLSVTENSNTSSATAQILISRPSSDFTIMDSVCLGETVSVISTDTSSINNYTWNFGGASIISGSGYGPYEISWASAGLKSISLISSQNNCNSDITTKYSYVKTLPEANFNLTSTGSTQDTINLNYSGSASSQANYTWDFDGAQIISGNGQGPFSLRWDTSGVKTVKLIVHGINQCFSHEHTSNIQLAPSSSFSADSIVIAGDSAFVSYTGNASPNAIYNWNFDSGVIVNGSGQGPYYVSWSTAGTKIITLSITENGVTSNQSTNQIIVKPTANIGVASTSCKNSPVYITYQGSADANATYNWNWDGGSVISGSGQGPYNVSWNTIGNKTISLIVTENGQSNSSIATINIKSLPTSSFTLTDSVCQSSMANISYTGTAGTNAIYNWNFSGATIISGTGAGPYQLKWISSGNKFVTLNVSENSCNSSQSTEQIYIKSTPSSIFSMAISANAKDTVDINYIGNASSQANYNWNFDNGNIIGGNGQNLNQVSWDTSGIHTVELSVIGNNSCSSPVSTSNIQIIPLSIFSATSPVTADSISTITYLGTSTSNANYNWNFDGANIISGSGKGPYQISWSGAGIKNISLSVIENGMVSNQTTLPVTVKPNPDFNAPTSICAYDTALINYQGSAGNSAIYNWNFDGGTIASGSGQGPYSVYWTSPGQKIIYLSLTNNGISSDTLKDTIIVNSIPSATFNASTPISVIDTCSVSYTGGSGNGSTFSWDFDGAQLISGVNNGPFKLKWNNNGIKNIKLSVSKNNCMSNEEINQVIVNPTSTFNIDSAICINSTANIVFTGQASVTANYIWDFNGGQIISGSGQGPYHIKWDTIGIKTISLTVVENGLSSNQTINQIIINSLPSVSVSQNNEICLYDSVLLTSVINSGVLPISYNWSTADTTPTVMVSPTNDSLFILQITDSNGCQISDTSLVLVKEPYANQEICIVTVDSTIGKNVIAWAKTPNVNTSGFVIFKESTVTNIFDSIGYRPYDSLSFFIDTASQPDIKSARYKMSVIDSCGNMSVMSPHHRTMHLTINKGIGWKFNLIWTQYEGFQVQTYRIWRWTYSGGWAKIDSLPGSSTHYTDYPPAGLTYYFVEIVSPYPCDVSKANTNYNISRSNTANTSMFNGIMESNNNLLLKVYPNPFSEKVNIEYELLKNSVISLEIYSALGKKVADITHGKQSPGIHKYIFNTSKYGYGQGVYYLRLIVDNQVITKKIIDFK